MGFAFQIPNTGRIPKQIPVEFIYSREASKRNRVTPVPTSPVPSDARITTSTSSFSVPSLCVSTTMSHSPKNSSSMDTTNVTWKSVSEILESWICNACVSESFPRGLLNILHVTVFALSRPWHAYSAHSSIVPSHTRATPSRAVYCTRTSAPPITTSHAMSCVSVFSAASRVAPSSRVANKRASVVVPTRAARVHVVAAVDLNGACSSVSFVSCGARDDHRWSRVYRAATRGAIEPNTRGVQNGLTRPAQTRRSASQIADPRTWRPRGVFSRRVDLLICLFSESVPDPRRPLIPPHVPPH